MELPVRAPVSGRRKTTYKLETKNLSYKLSSCCCQISTNKPPNQILINVNCEARPGEVTAIAGPSGAGKTTLLEILAGKISRRRFAGEVLVNEMPMEGKSFRRLSGYVTQEDALFPLLSVEETLMYSALLRLPGGRKEAGDRVNELITELGLDHVRKLRIGDGSNGGVSGGERRRVSIGVDLVHDPPVILIDEPTSGLDSASALHVVTLLKSMALSQHKTVVFTIHQPGFRILELIDRVVLLSTGLVIHNGTVSHLQDRLRFACHRIPRHVNVLEYAIDVIESLVVQSSRTIHFHDLNQENVVQDKNTVITSYENSIYDEVEILGRRFCSNIFRTKQLFATRVIQSLVAGFLLGTIFYNVGHEQGPAALQTLIGFFAFSLTFLLSSTTEALPIFLDERKILMTETSRGAYRVSSYVLANTLIFLPFLLFVGFLYATPVYFLVGLRQDLDGFMYFFMVVSLVLLMSNSFVSCFSALVPNFIMGTSMIAGLMGSFFLFSGYFIEKDHIPSYWVFMHYLSLFKYPFQCFMVNEFGGERGRRRCLDAEKVGVGGGCKLYGDGFLKQQGVEEWQKWGNVGVMLGFIVGYRVLCFLILWVRCYKTRS